MPKGDRTEAARKTLDRASATADKAQQKFDAAVQKQTAATEAVEEARAALAEAQRERDYAAAHPALNAEGSQPEQAPADEAQAAPQGTQVDTGQ